MHYTGKKTSCVKLVCSPRFNTRDIRTPVTLKAKQNSWSSGGSSYQRRLNLQFAMLITQGLNRPLYGFEGMLGNQDKMVEKSKVFLRIQGHLILAN